MQLQGKEGTELVLGYPCLPDGILGWGTAQGFHTQAPGSKVPWRVWGSCSQADDTGLPGWRRRLRGRPALGRLGKGTPPRAQQQQACSQAAGGGGSGRGLTSSWCARIWASCSLRLWSLCFSSATTASHFSARTFLSSISCGQGAGGEARPA